MSSAELNPSRGREQSFTDMLPLAKSNVRDFVFHSDPRHRFLPGNRPDVTQDTCGKWLFRGCLDHEKHGFKISEGQLRITGGHAKAQDKVEKYELSCGRLSCPVCYEKAASKEGARMENRIKQFRYRSGKTKYYHWAVSVPEELQYEDPEKLWKLAQDVSKMAGIRGGSMMFHHLRGYNEEDQAEDLAAGFGWKTAPASWYFSPHFHVIGVGTTSKDKIRKMHKKTGWVVVNLGERKSIKSTAHYQLSHAWIPEKGHAIRWFGCMSYNKLKVKPLPPQKHVCPDCGSEFQKLKFVSSEAEAIVKSMISGDGIYSFDHGFFEYSQKQKHGGCYG